MQEKLLKTLRGSRLTLEPLDFDKDPEILFDCFKDEPELFTWLPYDLPPTAEGYRDFLKDLPNTYFFMVKLGSDVVGLIAYLNVREAHRSVEIGHIIIRKAFGRKQYGIEAGIILVQHSIQLEAYRIEWKTHHENIASQRCALKIGFLYEGTFRNHMFVKGGHRHSLYYSLIPDDYVKVTEYQTQLLQSMVNSPVSLTL